MVQGGMKCVKYLLFIFNFVFFLAGLALIIAGAVVQSKFSHYVEVLDGKFSAAAILLIIVGVIIFVIGFFGCCGAYKEHYCMTFTFAVLLGIVFILEIAGGIAAYALRGEVKTVIEKSLMENQEHYGWSNYTVITESWDAVQQDFGCCGVNNRTDWAGKGNLNPGDVPDSCCKDWVEEKGKHCGEGKMASGIGLYQDGCLDEFESWVKSNIIVIGGVGIGLAFVQILGVILACCLARSIKSEYEIA